MNRRPIARPRQAAYSLVELTLATGILAAGVAAAASLTMTSSRIEEMNHRKARVLALTEGAARLWQLGLTPSQVASLLPGDPAFTMVQPIAESTATPNNQGAAVDPATDLGTFELMTIEAGVIMTEASSPTAGDGVVHELRPLRVVR